MRISSSRSADTQRARWHAAFHSTPIPRDLGFEIRIRESHGRTPLMHAVDSLPCKASIRCSPTRLERACGGDNNRGAVWPLCCCYPTSPSVQAIAVRSRDPSRQLSIGLLFLVFEVCLPGTPNDLLVAALFDDGSGCLGQCFARKRPQLACKQHTLLMFLL